MALAWAGSPAGSLAQEVPERTRGRLVVEAPGGRPVIFRHAPADSSIVALLAERAGAFMPAPVVPLDLPADTIEVVIATTEGEFSEMTGGRAPDWGLAVAFPQLRLVVMRSPRITGDVDVDPAIVLRHELAHVYLGVALGQGEDAVPRWFHEGFAALYAEEWRWVDPYRLAWARITGTLVPLAGLGRSFPVIGDPSVAYVQAMAAVRGLERRGGAAGLGQLITRMREGATFDQALRGTYGLTLEQYYAEWESELGRQYGWTVALTGQEGLWVFLAVVVIGLYWLRRRGIQRKIDARIKSEDRALGEPGDHSLGAEEWERYWEWDDDEEWKGEG